MLRVRYSRLRSSNSVYKAMTANRRFDIDDKLDSESQGVVTPLVKGIIFKEPVDTEPTLPRFFSLEETLLNHRLLSGDIGSEEYLRSMIEISYGFKQAYQGYKTKLSRLATENLLTSYWADKIEVFDTIGNSKVYYLQDITEVARVHKERAKVEVLEKGQKERVLNEEPKTEEPVPVESQVCEPVKESRVEELVGEPQVVESEEPVSVEPTEEEQKINLQVTEPTEDKDIKGTEEAEESQATEPIDSVSTEDKELCYDELECKFGRISKKKQGTKTISKKKKKVRAVKYNLFGNDFSVARDKSVLFYFIGKIENHQNLLSAIECKSGLSLSIKELNQRVRKNTDSHLQYTRKKVLIEDTSVISPDCMYLLINLGLRGKLSDLPLYILFFRSTSNSRFICQGRVESLEAYNAHVLNPEKNTRVVNGTLVEDTPREPVNKVVTKEKVVVQEEAVTQTSSRVQDSLEGTDETPTTCSSDSLEDDMFSVSDMDEWLKCEESKSSYSDAGSTVLEYSSRICRKPETVKCSFVVNVSPNFYKSLGTRLLDCWLSDNVYKCNIYLQILLARFESKMYTNNLIEGTHYLKSSNGRHYIINSGLLDIFGNDIYFSFRYTRIPKDNQYDEVQFHSLDVLSNIRTAKHLGCNVTLSDLYQLNPIRLWDKGVEVFSAKVEEFDFLSMERLLHVTHERRHRYPEAVSSLSADRLFTFIKDSIRLAVKISKIDSEYVKPIFYPCDVTGLEYFIPVHIFSSLSEEPELGVIVNKDSNGVWNVMTVLPYDVLLNNHKMLTIYSSRGRC